MRLNAVIPEDFSSFFKPHLTLGFPSCTFKCNKDAGRPVCQNESLKDMPVISISAQDIMEKYYIRNPITKAILAAGLEPCDSLGSLRELMETARRYTDDPIIIYSGYTMDELTTNGIKRELINWGQHNIILKVGRYMPDGTTHYDGLLGVTLASSNQKAYQIA